MQGDGGAAGGRAQAAGRAGAAAGDEEVMPKRRIADQRVTKASLRDNSLVCMPIIKLYVYMTRCQKVDTKKYFLPNELKFSVEIP